MRRVRESFAAKLLTALVGMVGALSLTTYVVVTVEAGHVVDAAVSTAVGRAERQLSDLESMQHRQVARLGQQVTQSRRTLAALDDALSGADIGVVADVVSQQLAVADLPDSDVLVVFTDPTPRAVLTVHGHRPMSGVDPVTVTPLAAEVLAGASPEALAYRVVGGQLYTVSTQLIQLAGRAIGTISFGLPLRNDDAQGVSDLVGAQVCYVVAGTCAAGSRRARAQLGAALAQVAGHAGPMEVRADGNTWSIRAEPLMAGDAAEGYRVIAVPLDGVLAPFTRISNALLVGGGAALAISLLLGIVLSRGLTRPVRDLVYATGRVAEGDYEAHVAETSRDEMGTLARAFNDMTRGLLLKERYRSVLHKVVSREVAEELMSGDVELGGENRDVTVLFADIRGFTSLTTGMEPQRVIGLLNECMERLSAAVEQEGGVVDKYVGDEIMAVFGAPVAQEDHATRGALSAVRMRRAIEELNAVRAARGESALGLGVGINSGPVVAGNMGSRARLNYTVLGETVNLAARLCAAAAPGEILLTARTHALSAACVRAAPTGARTFRGFARDIEVFALEDATVPLPPRRSSGRGMQAIANALLAAAILALPRGARAQTGGLPTLQQLGVAYQSPSGFYQISWSGQLDLELLSMTQEQIGLVRGGGTFLAPRARLFSDLFAGQHLYGLLELSADGGEAPTRGLLEGRVEQAYMRFTDSGGTFALQAGLFANPFGSYAGTRLTELDLFVRPSLPYDYRTVISPAVVARNPAAFQTWRDDPAVFRAIGAPPVWQVPYPWGLMAMGTVHQLSYRAAVVNSAPSSEPRAWHPDAARFRHPSYIGALRVALSPALAVEGSYDAGPYMSPIEFGTLPAGRRYWDYSRYIWSADVTYARGPMIASAEYLHDRWEVPNVGSDLVERGYVASVQSDLSAGVFAALRWSYLDFRPWNDVNGGHWTDDWDYDVARAEASLGFRFARNVGMVGSLLMDRQRTANAPRANLAAVRWWWAF